MEYTFASYKTSFRNVTYRSRLEAKWASFFTDLDWEFQYEPFDLNGWVPDFEIKTTTDCRLLVEVKPAYFPMTSDEVLKMYSKCLKHGKKFNILFLGIAPFHTDMPYMHSLAIGYGVGPHCAAMPDIISFKRNNNIAASYGSWEGMINNDGDLRRKDFLTGPEFSPIIGLWADAHNNTMRNDFKYYDHKRYPGA